MKSAAKLLCQTDKTCQCFKRNAKKMHFCLENGILCLFVVQMREIPELDSGLMDKEAWIACARMRTRCTRSSVLGTEYTFLGVKSTFLGRLY